MPTKIKSFIVWSFHSIYFWSAFISVACLFASALPFFPEIVRNALAIPAAGGFAAILIQLFRDDIAHQRALQLKQIDQTFATQQKQIDQIFARQQKQIDQSFSLGVATHMSHKVFDRQVEFCEEYAALLQTAVLHMEESGQPTAAALKDGQNLTDLRAKYVLWLPESVNVSLYSIESALKTMGSNAHVADTTSDNLAHFSMRERANELFFNIKGWNPYRNRENQPEIVAANINKVLQQILGVSDFHELRVKALRDANQVVEGASPVVEHPK